MSRVAVFFAFMIGISIPLRASGVATQQAAMGIALIAVFITVSKTADVRKRVRQALLSRLGIAVLIMLAVWAVTAFFSFDQIASLRISARTGGFMLASVLIWSCLSNDIKIQDFMWKVLIVSSVFISGLAVLSLNDVPYILSIFKGRMLEEELPYMAFKSFSATVMCLIPIIIYAGRRLGNKWSWVSYAFVPMAILIMMQTYNRAALAGVVGMVFVFIMLLAVVRKRAALPILAVGMIVVCSSVAWIFYKEFATSISIDETQMYLPQWLIDPHRQFIWSFVFDRFLDNPWFGVGIDQINKIPGAHVRIESLDGFSAWVPSHPHNWFLEVLAETGVVGLVPLLSVLFLTTMKLILPFMNSPNERDLTLIVFVAGFWSSALFNFSIWASWWLLTFFVLFAMVSASGKESRL